MQDRYNILNRYFSNEFDYVICDGVTKIERDAFINKPISSKVPINSNSTVETIEIPDSVFEIHINAFVRCPNLKEINVISGNPKFYSMDGVLYDGVSNSIFRVPCGRKGGFSIPDTVTAIERGAFRKCNELMAVKIPNSVTMIGSCAFEECGELMAIKLPDSLTEIEIAVFSGCSGLVAIEIPNSVTIINDAAFQCCKSLRSIRIPDSVSFIGRSAFNYCVGLESIEIPDSVKSISQDAFARNLNLREFHCKIKEIDNVYIDVDAFLKTDVSKCTLYVPFSTEEVYRHHPIFSNFKKIVTEID